MSPTTAILTVGSPRRRHVVQSTETVGGTYPPSANRKGPRAFRGPIAAALRLHSACAY